MMPARMEQVSVSGGRSVRVTKDIARAPPCCIFKVKKSASSATIYTHHRVAHQEYRAITSLGFDVLNRPLDISQMVAPTRLAISAVLALPLFVLRRAPEATLIECEHGNAPRCPQGVGVLVAGDVFYEPVNEYNVSFWRGGMCRISARIELSRFRPAKPSFCE